MDRPHEARGLCKSCYNLFLRNRSSESLTRHQEKCRIYYQKTINEHKARNRTVHLKLKYGLTEEQYLALQDGCFGGDVDDFLGSAHGFLTFLSQLYHKKEMLSHELSP